jgi:hypothetical protein
MASLSDRAFLYADKVRSNVTEEAFEELTGESERNWGLIVAAFVIGAVVAGALLVIGFRRITEIRSDSGTNTLAEPSLGVVPAAVQTRWWERWGGNARAGLSTGFQIRGRVSSRGR